MTQQLLLVPVVKLKNLVTSRWLRYGVLGVAGNAFIWGTSIQYLKVTKPIYTSEFGLILSAASFGVNVNLPGIGQATSSSGSAMGGSTYDAS